MYMYYLKIAFRNLVKYKTYSFINILGLGIGMACSIVVILWIQDELNFDNFHKNLDQLYRVVSEQHYDDGTVFPIAVTPANLGPAFKNEYPEIINYARFHIINKLPVRYGENNFYESRFARVDPSFFEMFSFAFIKGNPRTALSTPNSVVITEKIADKYFGNKDPMGKTLKIYTEDELVVTGVLKSIPANSHLQFDFLSQFEEVDWSIGWNTNNYYTYLHVQKNANIQVINSKIYEYYKTIFPAVEHKLFLQPAKDIHLYSDYAIDIEGSSKDRSAYLYIFSVAAVFILFIACMNFMNLMTAFAGKRVKEISMRKINGANKTDLIRQFYSETILFSFIALFFAILLVELALPVFNNLSGKHLSFNIFTDTPLLFSFVGMAFITGLISGSYPAIYLSSFQPIKILKASLKSAGEFLFFRKTLVVIQFTLSIIIIIGTLIVNNQLHFMQNKKLGFDKEHILYIEGDYNYRAFKTEALKNPNILAVSASSSLPTYTPYSTNDISWEGKNQNSIVLIHHFSVDYNFINTFDMEIVQGRDFSKKFISDVNSSYIVNETAVKLMGLENPLEKRFSLFGNEGKIIGVVKDFHFKSLHKKIEPLILRMEQNNAGYYTFFKINPDNVKESVELLEKIYSEFYPQLPFEYKFLDKDFDKLYRSEQHLGKIFNYFSLLAIFISCLGLLGLASFIAEQKTKEISVRKVLGAPVFTIVIMLSRDFTKWVFLANIIAWPIAWYVMNNWLQNFAYRIEIGFGVFIIAGIFALGISLFVVSAQAIKAALVNPIESLRSQ